MSKDISYGEEVSFEDESDVDITELEHHEQDDDNEEDVYEDDPGNDIENVDDNKDEEQDENKNPFDELADEDEDDDDNENDEKTSKSDKLLKNVKKKGKNTDSDEEDNKEEKKKKEKSPAKKKTMSQSKPPKASIPENHTIFLKSKDFIITVHKNDDGDDMFEFYTGPKKKTTFAIAIGKLKNVLKNELYPILKDCVNKTPTLYATLRFLAKLCPLETRKMYNDKSNEMNANLTIDTTYELNKWNIDVEFSKQKIRITSTSFVKHIKYPVDTQLIFILDEAEESGEAFHMLNFKKNSTIKLLTEIPDVRDGMKDMFNLLMEEKAKSKWFLYNPLRMVKKTLNTKASKGWIDAHNKIFDNVTNEESKHYNEDFCGYLKDIVRQCNEHHEKEEKAKGNRQSKSSKSSENPKTTTKRKAPSDDQETEKSDKSEEKDIVPSNPPNKKKKKTVSENAVDTTPNSNTTVPASTTLETMFLNDENSHNQTKDAPKASVTLEDMFLFDKMAIDKDTASMRTSINNTNNVSSNLSPQKTSRKKDTQTSSLFGVAREEVMSVHGVRYSILLKDVKDTEKLFGYVFSAPEVIEVENLYMNNSMRILCEGSLERVTGIKEKINNMFSDSSTVVSDTFRKY